jgi:hypothetical protein
MSLDSISSFPVVKDIQTMRREFCADVLIHENVMLRPLTSVTFGYLYPAVMKAGFVKTVLEESYSNLSEYLFWTHLKMQRYLESSYNLDPFSAISWAATKLLSRIPWPVVKLAWEGDRIDSYAAFLAQRKTEKEVAPYKEPPRGLDCLRLDHARANPGSSAATGVNER